MASALSLQEKLDLLETAIHGTDFPYDHQGTPLPLDEFRRRSPLACDYLASCLSNSLSGRGTATRGWHLLRNRPATGTFFCPKIVAAGINEGKGFSLDTDRDLLCANSVLIVRPRDNSVDPYYLLGVLNSRLFAEFMRDRSPDLGAGRTVYRVAHVKQFPLVLPGSAGLTEPCARIAAMARDLMGRRLSQERRLASQREINRTVADVYRQAGRPA